MKKNPKYLVQGPQYPVVMDIRNDKSTVCERVDDVSSFFVDFDSVKVSPFPGDHNSVGISREFSNPPEFNLEFTDD